VGVRVRGDPREFDTRDAGKTRDVPAGEFRPAGVERRDLAHLDDPDRGVQIGQLYLYPGSRMS